LKGFAFIQGEHALDVAHERPDEPPEQHGDSDNCDRQNDSDGDIQDTDPKRPDLKPVMGPQQRIGRAHLGIMTPISEVIPVM
jgi:hypothetical protein